MGQVQHNDGLPPIPEIDPELRELAESAAGDILKCGGKISVKVGIHVRDIDWWYRFSASRYINRFYHVSSCKYLRSLDAANSTAKDFYSLRRLEYLDSLKVGRFKNYSSRYGQGPTKQSKQKNWRGVGYYEIDQNPLYRRLGKKRDKPLPAMTDIKWIAKLKRLRELSIEVHNVSDLAPLSELKNLEILKLHGAKISTLEAISGLAGLKEIEFYNCAIKDFSLLEKFPELTKLHIERCDIDLLTGFPESLTYFRGQRNRIKDVLLEKELPDLSEFFFLRNEVTGATIGLDKFIK